LKTVSGRWKVLGMVLMPLAVVLALVVPAMPVLSAPIPCNTTITMPADLAGAGGKVEISGYGTFNSGDTPSLPSGQNVSWRLKVNGQTSQWYTKNVDCTALEVSQYCNMKITNVPAGGSVEISGTGNFTDGQSVVLPTGVTISWRLKVGGQTSQWYTKNVDCSDLNVTQFCDMQIKNVPAGGSVEIQGTGTYTNDQSVVLPICVTISWRLKVSGQTSQWYTKHVDCTPLDASKGIICQTSDARCNMKINNPAGGTVEIQGTGNFTDGATVVLPTGVTISWRLKVNGQTSQWYTKKVDCTPLVVGPEHYCVMAITNPAGGTVEIQGTGNFTDGDTVVLPICVTISWRLKVNGQTSQWYTKHVDCTPLEVDQFCSMKIVAPEGAKVEIQGTGNFQNNATVVLPICVTISYRVDGGAWQTKHVDCTDLKVGGP